MRADVEDDVRFDRARGLDRRAHRLDALLVEVVFRARQVHKVEGVDQDTADPQLAATLPEGGEIPRIVLRVAPGARALGEDLQRLDSELGGPIEPLLDPARTVSAE